MTKFFKNRNLQNVLDGKKMFMEVSGLDVNYADETSFITKVILSFSQKQTPRKMKLRLVIIECAGYIFWQLFLRRLLEPIHIQAISRILYIREPER